MARAHLNISIFPDERHILVRPKGELSGTEIGETSLTRILEAPDAFTYDHLLDLRRFDGASMGGELAAWFARRGWHAHLSLTDEGDYAQAFVVIETSPSTTPSSPPSSP